MGDWDENNWNESDFADSYFVVVDEHGNDVVSHRDLADAVRNAGAGWVRLTPAGDSEGPQVWPVNESPCSLDELGAFGSRHLWRPATREVEGVVLEFEIPPGTYYIGDPVHAVDTTLWHETLEKDRSGLGPVMSTTAGPFLLFRTGMDGGFFDLTGHRQRVDTASLGIVSRWLWPKDIDLERLEKRGRVITFDGDKLVASYPGGLLRFGHIVIELD